MKKKILFLALFFIFCSFLTLMPLHATTIAEFTVSPASVTFADRDPDLGEVTSSPSLSVTIRFTGLNPPERWILEIRADTDLVSGGNTIPAGNIRWTVTGSGGGNPTFLNGTLVRNNYLEAGRGSGQPGGIVNISGTFFFYLQNYWSYATGNYNGSVTFRLTADNAAAQTRTVTLSANIAARAKLQFGLPAMNFPDADPGSVFSIPSNVNPLSVTSSARTGLLLTVALTCLATGDLISGTNTIAINNLTWTASGTGYVAGTMNRTTPQTAGSWTGSGSRTGTFSYFLANFWSFNVGNYSTSINYTLTAP